MRTPVAFFAAGWARRRASRLGPGMRPAVTGWLIVPSFYPFQYFRCARDGTAGTVLPLLRLLVCGFLLRCVLRRSSLCLSARMSDSSLSRQGLAPRKVVEVARGLHLDVERILPHGHYVAKVIGELEARQYQPDGQLILASAMTSTPQGAGKTTATVVARPRAAPVGQAQQVLRARALARPLLRHQGRGTGGGGARRICRLADLRLSGNSGRALGQSNRMIAPTRSAVLATRYPAGDL